MLICFPNEVNTDIVFVEGQHTSPHLGADTVNKVVCGRHCSLSDLFHNRIDIESQAPSSKDRTTSMHYPQNRPCSQLIPSSIAHNFLCVPEFWSVYGIRITVTLTSYFLHALSFVPFLTTQNDRGSISLSPP